MIAEGVLSEWMIWAWNGFYFISLVLTIFLHQVFFDIEIITRLDFEISSCSNFEQPKDLKGKRNPLKILSFP